MHALSGSCWHGELCKHGRAERGSARCLEWGGTKAGPDGIDDRTAAGVVEPAKGGGRGLGNCEAETGRGETNRDAQQSTWRWALASPLHVTSKQHRLEAHSSITLQPLSALCPRRSGCSKRLLRCRVAPRRHCPKQQTVYQAPKAMCDVFGGVPGAKGGFPVPHASVMLLRLIGCSSGGIGWLAGAIHGSGWPLGQPLCAPEPNIAPSKGHLRHL